MKLSVPKFMFYNGLSLLVLARGALGEGLNSNKDKPNFIFIMADDQDLHLNSLDYQPAVQTHFKKQGTFFRKHFCTISQCCPSRVSLLTGKAAHNTNVTALTPPYGGYTGFVSNGWNEKYLPIWLQEAGYNTYYTGKLMNDHSTTTYNKPYPKGWNGTDFLIDPGTYIYYNSTTQRNRDPPKNNPGIYSTDLIASNAIGFLNEAEAAKGSFFLGITPIGPHGQTIMNTHPDGEVSVSFTAPVPADRHSELFPNLKVPRTPNFNPTVSSGASWIKSLDMLNKTAIDSFDDFYRKRIQALQAVDDLVDTVMAWLHARPEILDNTYIMYTSDNGFHIGQHRIGPGKACGIEEDINIPFFIRGPGVPKGQVVDYPTTHTDIVPTIFDLAGIPLHSDFDGEPIPVHGQVNARANEHVNVEFWGNNLVEGEYGNTGPGLVSSSTIDTAGGLIALNNTYKTVRVIGNDYNLMYTVWCTNEHELYDMTVDPYQMNNIFQTARQVGKWSVQRLESRLDALLMTLKGCSGWVCTRPWQKLHPQGKVKTLNDAMASEFDEFYQAQPKVTFTKCAAGNILAYEGAQNPNVFGGDFIREARWEDWV